MRSTGFKKVRHSLIYSWASNLSFCSEDGNVLKYKKSEEGGRKLWLT